MAVLADARTSTRGRRAVGRSEKAAETESLQQQRTATAAVQESGLTALVGGPGFDHIRQHPLGYGMTRGNGTLGTRCNEDLQKRSRRINPHPLMPAHASRNELQPRHWHPQSVAVGLCLSNLYLLAATTKTSLTLAVHTPLPFPVFAPAPGEITVA